MRRLGLCLVLVSLAACTTAPLRDPAPLAAVLPTPELTRTAILRALVHERFVVEDESPGRIRARFSPSWVMTVEIDYAKQISIRYARSELLGFEERDGVRYIHDGYNRRAQRLSDEIARESRLLLAEVDPDAFLGPPVGAPPPPESEAAH